MKIVRVHRVLVLSGYPLVRLFGERFQGFLRMHFAILGVDGHN